MKNNQCKQQQFIHPYRQNKRWFSKYLNKPKQNLSASNDESNKTQLMLDGISKASSIKIKQSVHQEMKKQQKSNIEHLDQNYMIYNKRKNVDMNNPQLFDLISKHLQSDKKINPVQNKIPNNHTKSSSFKKMSKLSPAPIQLQKLQKIPKITQFTRQTFYKNISTSRNYFSSKKQSQDNLHCKSDLDINTKKISIFKKTKTNPDKKLFYTYEIYSINMRVGIMVQILAGSLKQIKFRLILNQNDTKTFNKFWKLKPQQFIQKCLIVNQLGISLKVGPFNEQNPKVSRIKTSRIKQLQKAYLQSQRQSIVKKQQYRKLSAKKIGSKFYSQQYDPQQVQKNANKEKQNSNDIPTQLIQQKQMNSNKISKNQQPKKQEDLISPIQHNKQQQQHRQMELIESFVSQSQTIKKQDITKQKKNQQKIIESQSKIFQQSKPEQIIGENSIG